MPTKKTSTSEMIQIMEEAFESQKKLLDFTKKLYLDLLEVEKTLPPLSKETDNPKYLKIIHDVELTNKEKIAKLTQMRKDNKEEFIAEFGLLKDAKIIIEQVVLTEKNLPPPPLNMLESGAKVYCKLESAQKYEERKSSKDEGLADFAWGLVSTGTREEEEKKFQELLKNYHPEAHTLFLQKVEDYSRKNKANEKTKELTPLIKKMKLEN